MALWTAYEPNVTWEEPSAVQDRVCRLLPMLMLGRIDGKSPIEYLDDAARGTVRGLARALIETPAPDLARFLADLRKDLIRQ